MRTKLLRILKQAIIAILLFMGISNAKAQGVDVIFWMDNSASIDNTEWTNMTNSTKSLIDMVLGCNPNNRVAVVHYAGYVSSTYLSRIWIESDFTSDATTAKSFLRRGGNLGSPIGTADFAHEALGIIGNALDGISNTNIMSPQQTLARNSNNRLVVFLFTDAERTSSSSVGSFLVRASGSGGLFDNYNAFKSIRKASFVVVRAPTALGTDAVANAASAAIASVGGSYTGTVEANAGDPEGSGIKPRRMTASTTFAVSASDLLQIQSNICSSCAPTAAISAVTPPTQTLCQNAVPQNLVATASGTGTLSYQWYSNTTNSNTGGTLISGATSATYTPSTATAGTQYYYVVVSDTSCDGKTASPVVSVTVSNITVSVSPATQTIANNTNITNLTATATGATSYQWYSNTTNSNTGGVLISGATSTTYTPPFIAAGIMYYYVVIGNGTCSATSSAVKVIVKDTDGDGVPDNIDLDNDNDGILDTIECNGQERIIRGNFTTLPSPSGNLTSTGFATATSNAWILASATTSGGNASTTQTVYWGSIPQSSFGNGIQFEKDGKTQSITQSVSNINNSTSDGALPQINISKFLASNGGSALLVAGQTATFTLSYAGKTYATIVTTNGIGADLLTIQYSNGATGSHSSITMGGILSNWAIILPDNVPNSGNLVLGYSNVTPNNNNSGDDFAIGNISIVTCGDTDGDGIPNYLDLDSDGDGCLDAMEGDENVTFSQLINAQSGLVAGTGSTASNQNLCAGNTCVDVNGIPLVVNFGGAADIGGDQGQGIGDSQNAGISTACLGGPCYKPGAIATAGNPALISKMGITSLNRAGTQSDNWPMGRTGGWLVLEAKTKGFVPNRIAFNASGNPIGIPPANFVEGMMVYDTTNKCLKIYTSNDNGSTFGWYCITTQTCPD